MTPEKLKEIEAKAQEAFKNGTYNDKMYDWLQENRRVGYITGALSLQPELDTLQSENDRLRERVRELEFRPVWVKLSERKPNDNSHIIVNVCYKEAPDYLVPVVMEFYSGKWVYETEEEGLCIVEWLDENQSLTKPADSTGGGEKEGCAKND